MSEVIGYKIQQIVDNGQAIQMSLVEDVQTEPVSQKQLIMENVSKNSIKIQKNKSCHYLKQCFKHNQLLK